jgi:hypothetical protein
MGFTSWSYGPELSNVDDTYAFLAQHGDIYAEHIDNTIPWKAWMNDEPLPASFTNEIIGRVNRKIPGHALLLSVSVLSPNRDEIAADVDGNLPSYTSFNDQAIRDAYYKHIDYLVNAFKPDYLVIAIEVNELRLRAPEKWDGYTQMIADVRSRIKAAYPDLQIAESVSLHNYFAPEVDDPNGFIQDITEQISANDFAAISYYPFLKGQRSEAEFQESIDFLHEQVNLPIAFVETAHLAEDLNVPNLNVAIEGNPEQQRSYLETLIKNAAQEDYLFIIWWAHRDFDALWETFPEEVKDLGQLWRDTGLLDEEGNERSAFERWTAVFAQ